MKKNSPYNEELVILTGTINPSNHLKDYGWVLSSDVRLQSYLSTIIFYITHSYFKYIVFCENSMYNLRSYSSELEKLADSFGKKLEILQYEWNHGLSEKLWFWYWEWECIDYAIDHSKLIKDIRSFWKITWRYTYSNINDLIMDSLWMEQLFFKNFSQVVWVYTWLFKVDKNFYKKHLYGIKDNIYIWINLENLYYQKLLKLKFDYGKIKRIPQRIASIPFDYEEVMRRKPWVIWSFLFIIWQWSCSRYSIIIDKLLIFMMNVKHSFTKDNS